MGLAWSSVSGNETFSPAAVAGGTVYVGSAFDVSALNAVTGAVQWSYSPGPGPTYFSAPAVADGIVYVDSGGGTVYALSAATGTLVWSYDSGGSASSSPTSPSVANGIVYVTTNNDYASGTVFALNATTGALDWSYDSGPVTSSPAVANGVVYVYAYPFGIEALNAATGGEEWLSVITGSTNFGSSPAVADGMVYIGDAAGQVYALNAAGGETEWERTLASPSYASSPAVTGGNCLTSGPATTCTRWTRSPGRRTGSTPPAGPSSPRPQ